MINQIHIGTSGWSYKGWIGDFYPPQSKACNLLQYYAQAFKTVELNSSFYHLPLKKTVEKWFDETPSDFLFSCKASRYITHIKKLPIDPKILSNLIATLDHLHQKLGPILFQLPPSWPLNLERLTQFLQLLPSEHHYVFEFRNKTWLCEEVYQLLYHYNIALCFYDYRGFQAPEIITSNFIYLRLHGPMKQPYRGNYPLPTLKEYAKKILIWKKTVKSIYCYFDNDEKVCAPSDAKKLLSYVYGY